jgi:putative ABC transport system permease protein
MRLLALKMLIGNRASCIGVIFGVFLATLLISQQSAIFLGLVSKSYRMINDMPEPNLWIMNRATESDDKYKGMPVGNISAIKSIPGIEWAGPIDRIDTPIITPQGVFQLSLLYGIDDATFIGAPLEMIEGNVRDLRRENGVIVDSYSAKTFLSKKNENNEIIPLKVGDQFEINDRRAVVVGICKITQGFYPQPIIYTAYSEFLKFNPQSINRLPFIAAKTIKGSDVEEIIKRIDYHIGVKALTKDQFKNKIVESFLKTGILINFMLSVGLGIIIGFSIAGQTFYIMTLGNLKYYALIKSLGATKRTLFQMIALQVFLMGALGFIIGINVTLLWGYAIKDTTLAFLFNFELLTFTGFLVFIICVFTTFLSMRKIQKIDPIILMGA